MLLAGTLRALILLALCPEVRAHGALAWPPSFRSVLNPHVPPPLINYDHPLAPLSNETKAAHPLPFPCKGFVTQDMKNPSAEGASVVTYETGKQYNITIRGTALHGGGSCQISISPGTSVPTGDSFRVVKSFIGKCPIAEKKYDFVVPSDTPLGGAILSWTWFNNIGNREMYQDCASVTIVNGNVGRKSPLPFSSRPKIFMANIPETDCKTIENFDVQFPDPGPEVEVANSNSGQVGYTGNCGPSPAKLAASPAGMSVPASLPSPLTIISSTTVVPTTSLASMPPTKSKEPSIVSSPNLMPTTSSTKPKLKICHTPRRTRSHVKPNYTSTSIVEGHTSSV